MKLQAFGKNILIKPFEVPVDPNAIQEAKAIPDELTIGEIVDIVWIPMGNPNFSGLEKGTKVLIAKDAGEEVEVDGFKYKVIQASHILCLCSEE